ncbi:MAG: iron ABC transporter permease [Desulfobacteraceae bacterium]
MVRPIGLLMCVLVTLLAAGIVLSTGMGYLKINWYTTIQIIVAKLTGQNDLLSQLDPVLPTVVMDVRLPRILTAAAVGGGLAICGTVFQGILLNPLADPYTLGVSAGAAFGAALAIILNISFVGTYSITLMAFMGAVITLALVIYLSAGTGGLSSNNLILSGIIVAAILSAGISFLKYLADEQVGVIIFWLMGSFASRTWMDVVLISSATVIGLIIFLIFARDLNLLSLGERTASSLGVNTGKTTLILLVTASLLSAVCVSVSGIIGFVGLLIPHLMRSITGPDNLRLLPVSLLAGATLLLIADTITRAVLPQEVPIGILTALIGGPFFCYIFRRRQTGKRGF